MRGVERVGLGVMAGFLGLDFGILAERIRIL
jgi:hypothetical protein